MLMYIFARQMDSVQVQVLSPLNSLLSLFQGPQRLIQKRNDKCLDYDRWSNKIDKIKDRDKLKAVSLCVMTTDFLFELTEIPTASYVTM